MSENLARWLGQSCLRRDGRPLQLLHGSAVEGTTYDAQPGRLPAKAFTRFDPDKRGSVTESSDAQVGFWFTTSEERADMAAAEAAAVAGHCHSSYVFRVYLKVERPLVLGNVCDYDPAEVAKLANAARRNGHDGVIFEQGERGGIDVLVFKPGQIKSADCNSGLYDPESDDITDAHGFAEPLHQQRERMRA